LSEPFRVNSYITNTQIHSRIAVIEGGGFVVSWKDDDTAFHVKARFFSWTGQPQSEEIVVSQTSTNVGLIGPSVATDSIGNTLVAWRRHGPEGDDIYARRLNALGVPLGDEFLVNSHVAGFQGGPRIAISGNGGFVVVWSGDGPGGSGSDVYAQAFDGSAQPIGDQFRVNTHLPNSQGVAAIAMNASGNLVVAWTSTGGQDGDGDGVYAQRFRPGVPQVQSTRINDGAAQRSRVTSLTVTFDTIVNFESNVADAFTLVRNGGKPISFKVTASNATGVTVITLNDFTGSSSQFGSLADGRYTLTALASHITDNLGQALDGDANGQPGGNYHFGDAHGLFRMFGDINGDRQVDGFDFGALSFSYSSLANQPNYLWFLDVNGDGQIDGFDLSQFSGRFNTLLP
jgi:hypothetical protein